MSLSSDRFIVPISVLFRHSMRPGVIKYFLKTPKIFTSPTESCSSFPANEIVAEVALGASVSTAAFLAAVDLACLRLVEPAAFISLAMLTPPVLVRLPTPKIECWDRKETRMQTLVVTQCDQGNLHLSDTMHPSDFSCRRCRPPMLQLRREGPWDHVLR